MVLRVFLVLFQGFVVGATIGVGFLETLVAAIVPVDGIDRGCQSAYDERQFPVTFVIDLSGTGEDRGQCRGFLYGGGVVAVVDRRIAQEVKVGGDRKPEIDLPARIAADHTGLYVVQLLRAGRTVFQQGVVLSFERFVGVVFVEEEGQSRTYRSVEDRQLPILLVVDLSETGRYQRDPTYARQRDGIAPGAEVFSACERVGRSECCGQGVGFQKQGRVGDELRVQSRSQRIPEPQRIDARTQQRIAQGTVLKQRVHPHQ